MNEALVSSKFYICDVCGNPIEFQEDFDETLRCPRCGEAHRHLKPKSIEKTLAFSLTGLIFYVPANLFPFMTIELYGHRNSSTIWGGIVSLAEGGSWVIALVVFLASLLIPLLKLLALFYLSFTARNGRNREFKTRLFRVVETVGRWSMLDIFLLAVLVAIMKLGPWTTVEPELGSLLFVLVVIFTMMASGQFDPQLLWTDENEKSDKRDLESAEA